MPATLDETAFGPPSMCSLSEYRSACVHADRLPRRAKRLAVRVATTWPHSPALPNGTSTRSHRFRDRVAAIRSPRAVELCAMRRWYRSGAFPVHRHSLVQLLVDGLLVALAYMLAFELRFDNGIPPRYDLLRDATILWVVPLCIVVLAAFGLYQRLWTYVGQRDYEAVVARCVVAALLVVGGDRARCTRSRSRAQRRRAAVALPIGVIAMWFLLTLFLTRRRALPRAPGRSRAASRGFRAAQGRARRADRRRRRRRPPGRARAAAQPASCGCARSASSTTTRASAGMKDEHGLKVLGTTSDEDLARDPRRGRARRGHHRDPVGAGHAARPRRDRLPPARRSRSARCRPCSSCCRTAAAAQVMRQLREVQRRGRARPRAGADGARARRRLPRQPGRARHRRRRLDRRRAVPPDRARRPAQARARRPRRGQPVRDRARARGGAPRAHRRARCWPTARRRSGCGRCSPSTARRSSSTPPPTSTSG